MRGTLEPVVAILEYSLIVAILVLVAVSAQAAAPVRIENGRMALEFDAVTGAWTGLVDKATGENLATGAAAGVPFGLSVPRLDPAALETAVAAGKAISIEGTWRFAAEPKEADAARLAARRASPPSPALALKAIHMAIRRSEDHAPVRGGGG